MASDNQSYPKDGRHPSLYGKDLRKNSDRPSWYPLLSRPPSEVASIIPDEWKSLSMVELYRLQIQLFDEHVRLVREKAPRDEIKQFAVKMDLLGDYVLLRRSESMRLKL